MKKEKEIIKERIPHGNRLGLQSYALQEKQAIPSSV